MADSDTNPHPGLVAELPEDFEATGTEAPQMVPGVAGLWLDNEPYVEQVEEAKAETVADVKARLTEASDEDLEALALDERKGVQDAVAAEQARRQQGGGE